MQTFTPFQSANLRALIQSTLTPMGLYSANAEELLLATCAQESLFGTYRTQGGSGPARGIFQMEGEDHDDIWKNFVVYHPTLASELTSLSPTHQTDDMVMNDPYAVAMCRIHYLRASGSLPSFTDLNGLWYYYKKHYNTEQGAATQEEFNEHYARYVTDGKAT